MKDVENEKDILQDLKNGKKKKQCKMWKMRMQSVGPEIWRETLKNVENEKCTLQDLEYAEKTEKYGKRTTNTV